MTTNYVRPISDCEGGYILGDGSFLSLDDGAASDDQWVHANATMRIRMIAEHSTDIRHGREVAV